MKTNLTILLYYKILYTLIYLPMKYLKIDNLFRAIFFIFYLLSSTLLILWVLSSLNIVGISSETVNYLDELDFPVELIEHSKDKEDKILNNSIFSKFLNLFNHSYPGSFEYPAGTKLQQAIPNELKNSNFIGNNSHFYLNEYPYPKDMDQQATKQVSINVSDKYLYQMAIHKKVVLHIETLSEVLNDLKSINENITSNIKNI